MKRWYVARPACSSSSFGGGDGGDDATYLPPRWRRVAVLPCRRDVVAWYVGGLPHTRAFTGIVPTHRRWRDDGDDVAIT